MTTTYSPEQKMAAARMIVLAQAPYFASILLGMIPRAIPGLTAKMGSPIGVSAKAVLVWDPDVIGTWTVKRIAAALVHEVFHLIRDDHGRSIRWGCGENQALNDQANVAQDMANNDDIRKAGWDVGENWCYPEQIKMAEGLTAEEYFAVLRQQRAPPSPQGGRGDPSDCRSDGADAGDQGGDPLPPSFPWSLPRSVGSGRCGSCSGNAIPGEPADGKIDGQKTPERSAADLSAMRREVAQAIKEAVKSGKGNVPGSLVRWADASMAPPKVRWQDQMARLTRAILTYRPGATTRRYTWPSRRQGGYGYGPNSPRVPGTRRAIPRTAFIQDTSGSMGSDQFGMARREVRGVLQACGGETTMMACDAQVNGTKQLRSWQEFDKLLVGGGGSDFRPAFDAIAKLPRPIDLAIFSTDGFIDVPEEAPPYRVIWLLCGKDAQPPTTRYGDVIRVD